MFPRPQGPDQKWPINNIATTSQEAASDSPAYAVNQITSLHQHLPQETVHLIHKDISPNDQLPMTLPKNLCKNSDNTLLLSYMSQLIKEKVLCGSVEIMAVVDTGAAVSVLSTALLRRTSYPLCDWNGLAIVLANGTRAVPLGGAHITITHHNKSVSGTAVVMQMEGMEFLTGNDFLRQFGQLHVDYTGSTTQVILGELPFSEAKYQAPRTRSKKVCSREGCIIPAFSVVSVGESGIFLDKKMFLFIIHVFINP
jgi:hypothetical protein